MPASAHPRRLAVFLCLALATSALGACGLQEKLDEMDREKFEHACTNLGIARGTPSWDQCMIQQQASANYDEQQFLNRVQQRETARELTRHR